MGIVTAPGLVITPDYDYEPHHPLVCWENKVTFSGLTSDSAVTGNPVTNLANQNTNNLWKSGSTAEQLVTVSSLDGETDSVNIARHNLGSAAVLVSVETLTAEPGAVFTEVFAPVYLADDSPAILRFAKGYYTDVRLRLVPTATAPQIGILYVGALTALKPGLEPGFVPLSRAKNYEVYSGRSTSGEYLGAIITGGGLQSSASIRDIDPDFYGDVVAPFLESANLFEPFFFAWSPDAYPSEVAFAWLTSPALPNISRNTLHVDISLSMAGLIL